MPRRTLRTAQSRSLEGPASFRPLHGQRSARLIRSGGFGPSGIRISRARSVPERFLTRYDRLSRLNGRICDTASALAPRRTPAPRGGNLAATCLDGPTRDAPDCADQDPRHDGADAKRSLRAPACPGFLADGAPRIAIGPFPHPRIRWTVASSGRALSACRHPRPPPARVEPGPTKC